MIFLQNFRIFPRIFILFSQILLILMLVWKITPNSRASPNSKFFFQPAKFGPRPFGGPSKEKSQIKYWSFNALMLKVKCNTVIFNWFNWCLIDEHVAHIWHQVLRMITEAPASSVAGIVISGIFLVAQRCVVGAWGRIAFSYPKEPVGNVLSPICKCKWKSSLSRLL